MDWSELFGLSISPLELFIRGSTIYWFIFLIFRVVLRREVGALGIADVLVIVLIADASQNAMTGEYRSITDGMVLISTIVLWNVVLDWAAYRSAWLARLLEPAPLVLIERGRMLHANMRREFLTPEELLGKLREKGVDNVSEVKRAVLETDGEISVIRLDRAPSDAKSRSATRV